MLRLILLLSLGVWLTSCSTPASPDPTVPGPMVRRTVVKRTSAVIVTDSLDIGTWAKRNFRTVDSPGDADGGSATPISPDGYFLTADHVIEREDGRSVFVLTGGEGGRLVPYRARVVWRSKKADLALLHIRHSTPDYYKWTPPSEWLPVGTPVIHGGLATGTNSGWGKLGSSLKPERTLSHHRMFKMDIPLQPGDSGGPVVDARGLLVGINSAVEYLVSMETPFFIDSEASRPHLGHLTKLVHEDRQRNRPEADPVVLP